MVAWRVSTTYICTYCVYYTLQERIVLDEYDQWSVQRGCLDDDGDESELKDTLEGVQNLAEDGCVFTLLDDASVYVNVCVCRSASLCNGVSAVDLVAAIG